MRLELCAPPVRVLALVACERLPRERGAANGMLCLIVESQMIKLIKRSLDTPGTWGLLRAVMPNPMLRTSVGRPQCPRLAGGAVGRLGVARMVRLGIAQMDRSGIAFCRRLVAHACVLICVPRDVCLYTRMREQECACLCLLACISHDICDVYVS